MLLGAAAEGAASDVVPQLLDQLRVLLLDLLSKLLPPDTQAGRNWLSGLDRAPPAKAKMRNKSFFCFKYTVT